jgi:uncharacterized membrane protein YoaK (UPF0700 family)
MKRPVIFAVAILLTWIAGFVDAAGYLTFARIYTANMSGNSIALGIAVSDHNWPMAVFRFWPILLYVCGLIFGRSLIEIGVNRRMQRVASAAFACEVFLLVVVMWVPQSWQYLPIALLAMSMGIQNSALTQFSSLTLHSGFVTGTLLKFSEELVAFLATCWPSSRPVDKKPLRLSLFLALTWLAYVLGAVAGAWGKSMFQARALLAPIAGLVLLITLDIYRPMGIQEVRKQAQLE